MSDTMSILDAVIDTKKFLFDGAHVGRYQKKPAPTFSNAFRDRMGEGLKTVTDWHYRVVDLDGQPLSRWCPRQREATAKATYWLRRERELSSVTLTDDDDDAIAAILALYEGDEQRSMEDHLAAHGYAVVDSGWPTSSAGVIWQHPLAREANRTHGDLVWHFSDLRREGDRYIFTMGRTGNSYTYVFTKG